MALWWRYLSANGVNRQAPIGAWPKDRRLKEIGRYERAQVLDAVEVYTLALFTRVLDRSPHETQVFLERVKSEMVDPTLRLYTDEYIIYGRKPELLSESAPNHPGSYTGE
jgi:hypothetical protein